MLKIIDVKPTLREVLDIKALLKALDTKPRLVSVLQETTTYQDSMFLRGMPIGPGFFMFVTHNGNRY